MKTSASLFLLAAALSASEGQHTLNQPHYLVGLLNYPNAFVPDILQNHTSGTYIDPAAANGETVPFSDIPGVGFSDIEMYYDEAGMPIIGEYYVLSDNGYGSPDNSGDYALNIQHLKIQKPFTYRHGESTFDPYTPVENLGAALIHDPDGFIKWENGADIQVTYHIPDDTWRDYRDLRVLTGRDVDVEGLAVLNQTCAIVGEELMPSIFMVNPKTGVVLSPFVRTPDIDADGTFNGAFLSTIGDKVHCTIEALQSDDQCTSVESSVVDASDYRKHDPSGGFEGFALLADGTVAAFVEKNSGDTTLNEEPGVRVYHVIPGDCSPGSAPVFDSFLGYYKFEHNAGNIADVSAIPGSSRFVAVIERNGFPVGHMFPAPAMPANKVCIVDLFDLDENMVMHNKKCILNYHNIDDPWDVDGNGILKYAQTQVTNEALVIVDDYCMVAGTDTNFPWTNPFGLEESMVPNWQEVADTRFMIVCFVEPIFHSEMLEEFMVGTNKVAGSPPIEDSLDVTKNGSGRKLRGH